MGTYCIEEPDTCSRCQMVPPSHHILFSRTSPGKTLGDGYSVFMEKIICINKKKKCCTGMPGNRGRLVGKRTGKIGDGRLLSLKKLMGGR